MTIMANENIPLANLKKSLLSNQIRTKILYFELVSRRLNSRLHFILNEKGEFHLNICNPTGPDTCQCHKVLDAPDIFFEDCMNTPPNYCRNVPNSHLKKNAADENLSKPLFQLDEDVKDFYQFRVLDLENISKWYEAYEEKTNVLNFRVKVRELKIENEIDTVYNPESKEIHLTDCIRSVHCDLGSDTCHCRKAMMDPMKYLKLKYNFIEVKKKKNNST